MPLLALALWPIIAMILFSKLPFARALCVSTLTGYLLLPEAYGVDLPGLPSLDKGLVLAVGMGLGFLLFRNKTRHPATKAEELHNSSPLVGRILFIAALVLLTSPIMTILDNRAPVIFGAHFANAMRPWDLVSMTLDSLLIILPFFLGRKYLASPENHRMLLILLVFSGVCYTLLMLVELRLSPQLNKWVYGYHQHSFAQHIRGGSYRPKVFLRHGLWVGFFMFSVVIAAMALSRSSSMPNPRKYLWAGLWALVILLLSKNLGAVGIAFLMLGALFLLPRTWQVRLTTTVALLFILYPAVRQADLIPLNRIMSVASGISADRAQSLQFRLDNEDELLARAQEKPIFGWGGWSRGLIFNENGRRTSVSDGVWIIILGVTGWVGYVAFFSLLTVPLFALRRAWRRKGIPVETIALALITAGNLIYLIPNSTLSPIGWLMAGALAGFVQFDARDTAVPDPSDPLPSTKNKRPKTRYTRFGVQKKRGGQSETRHKRSTSTP